MPLTCPVCRIDMTPTEYAGLNLDVCPQCAGIWFDDGELRALVKSSPDALEALDAQHVPELEVLTNTGSHRYCPRDNAVLETYKYAYDNPVKLDSCPTCGGVFVEDRELAGIHDSLQDQDRSRMTKALGARANYKTRKPETVSGLIHALHHWRETSQV